MDAADILGSLLGHKTSRGGRGGRVLTDIFGSRSSRSTPAPSRPPTSAEIQREATRLEGMPKASTVDDGLEATCERIQTGGSRLSRLSAGRSDFGWTKPALQDEQSASRRCRLGYIVPLVQYPHDRST